jgi:hypothetical protein
MTLSQSEEEKTGTEKEEGWLFVCKIVKPYGT